MESSVVAIKPTGATEMSHFRSAALLNVFGKLLQIDYKRFVAERITFIY